MTEAREPRAGLLLALCLLLVACVYARALGGPFLWDDRHLVLDSELLRTSSFGEWFTRPFWLGPAGQADSVSYYRPLTALSFRLDFAVHGENSTGYHLTNLLLHWGATSGLFLLLLRRGVPPTLTFLLATTWALLPRSSEAVAWISGRGDALSTCFVFAALLAYRPGSLSRLVVACVLGFGALLSKEPGAAVLVSLGILELGRGNVSGPARWARGTILLAPFAVYVALRAAAGANPASALARAFSPALSVEALGRYAFMLIDAWRPRSLIGQVTRTDWLFVALGAGTLLGVVALCWRARPWTRDTASAFALAALPILMVSHLVPLPVTVVAADRYLYLPSAALLLAVAPVLSAWARRERWVPAALLLVLLASAVRTFQRAGDYADEAQFWSEAIRTSPWSSTGFVELGGAAYRAGLFEDGLRLSQRGAEVDALGTGQALDNAALMAMASGRRELAARLGERLARAFPSRPAFQLRRAVIALNAGDYDTAQRFGETAQRLSPSYAAARKLLRTVEDARRAATSAVPPPEAVAQRLDAEALRYPELEARLRRGLRAPAPDRALLAAGVELLVVRAEPSRAAPLLAMYRERFGAEGTEAAQLALDERAARAKELHARITALVATLR